MGPVRHQYAALLLGSDGFVFCGLGLACSRFAGRFGFSHHFASIALGIIGRTDRRGKNRQIKPGFASFIFVATLRTLTAFETVIAVAAVAVAIVTVPAIVALGAPIFALFAIIAVLDRNVGFGIFFFAGFDVALVFAPFTGFAIFVAPFVALRTVFFLPAAVIGEYTEIMVSKLVIIFGLHPIAVQLGVLGQLFVLLQHLGCVAPRTIIDAILVIIPVAICILRAIIAPAATAAGLSVIHKD